ncbi:MAG: PAC2 family protein [Bifidobacteriaceae bacterium]|jgi:hypothetical protein|nr:PAC2 family protein [Bifidobacteriaceae bacterium]
MTQLYTVNQEAAARLEASGVAPVMLYAFDGFIDSGIVAGLAIGDLIDRPQTIRLVSFNADELVDYRSRRPPMTLGEDGWSDFQEPSLGIDLVYDAAGSPFLLMYGPEPDMRWDAFTDAVSDLVETFDVRLALGIHGIPAASPHTRTWPVTATDDCKTLVAKAAGSSADRIQFPSSVMAWTEVKLREIGRDARTLVVHVPHYLVQVPSPMGTLELMRAVSQSTGLEFDLASIAEAADVQRQELDQQIAARPELAAAIAKLEDRQDASSLAAPGGELPSRPLPTGDEIAAEFERYLAAQNETGEDSAFTG